MRRRGGVSRRLQQRLQRFEFIPFRSATRADAKSVCQAFSDGPLSSSQPFAERFRGFKDAGLTELSLRLHDKPLEALKLITERVMPALN